MSTQKKKVKKVVVDKLNIPVDLGYATFVIKKITQYIAPNYFATLRSKPTESEEGER